MSEEIIKVIDELGKRFGIVIDWSSQNIIPYLQDLMKRFICYKNIEACIWIIICITMVIGGIVLIKFINKWRKSDNFEKGYSDDEFLSEMGYIFSIFIMVIGIVLIIGNIIGIVENICMPEMVVYEYITSIQ